MGYEQARQFVAKWEGGLVNHPADPGGLTNYGISLRFLRALGHDVDGDGDVDADDIKALTVDTASDLLKQEFWTCQDLDSFPPLVAIAHYDASVNCGRSRAVKFLQDACNALPGSTVKVDGRLGPKTRARLYTLNADALALRTIQVRQAYYTRLVAEKPDLAVFLDGWMNRTNDLIKYVRGGANAQTVSDVAATQVEPMSPVLPTPGPRDEQTPSASVVQSVGAGVPGLGTLIADVSKRLGKSPAAYGASGLFAMLVGNVRLKLDLWIFDNVYHFEDAGTLAALLAMGIIAWGIARRPTLISRGKPNA